ncbi:Rqc2 family fibronectin-binding protein [Pseudalkalibacillus berkeleyi]|uniref:Rqc2 homolog RqcH n=1 Tax=Pseudalkalibacillus berkeleyi TaxID=1069813 RepID=A0ABS9GZF1_9BACL|nr:NFACT RNA binding domain-containing protein [Pseudalkalibacillus berkeleyi]MCF6137046.1 NFACT family protein [Pseudalkalibacillus berkeleyi]
MSFDGIMTRAITHELKEQVAQGKITKIYQPFPTELILVVRSKGKSHKILLSANASYPRVHLTEQQYENPKVPPMFCMLLRKHLEGGVIDQIEQPGMERMIIFHVAARNEIGDITHKRLIIEIMGRHSNITVIDADTNQILDCVKHIPPSQNRYRTMLPGSTYMFPPEQDKLNPLETDEETFIRKLDFNSGKIDKQIVQQFEGIAPLVANEIIARTKLGDRQSLSRSFVELMNNVNEHVYKPQMILTETKEYFSVVELTHIKGERSEFTSVSTMLDRFYFGKAERDRVKQRASDLEKFLRNELKKNQHKIPKLRSTLSNSEKADQFKLYGELITANIYQLDRGMNKAEVQNFYEEEAPLITVPLDTQKTPSENAQHYFKKYNKLKNSIQYIQQQLKETDDEIRYLESLLQQLESASASDVEEIREELEEGHYLKKRKNVRKRKKNDKPSIEKYLSSSNVEIWVGKNNKQNDYLTNKFANAYDIWLHTKDIPGSHVVIRNSEPDETTIMEAANIAAYFSKAKHSSSVPVDYTHVKHVKKPSGAKPGFVTYDNQKTVHITPDENLVYNLRHK